MTMSHPFLNAIPNTASYYVHYNSRNSAVIQEKEIDHKVKQDSASDEPAHRSERTVERGDESEKTIKESDEESSTSQSKHFTGWSEFYRSF